MLFAPVGPVAQKDSDCHQDSAHVSRQSESSEDTNYFLSRPIGFFLNSDGFQEVLQYPNCSLLSERGFVCFVHIAGYALPFLICSVYLGEVVEWSDRKYFRVVGFPIGDQASP